MFISLLNDILLHCGRSVGGLRVSLYNAITLEEVTVLVNFMEEFRQKHSGSV